MRCVSFTFEIRHSPHHPQPGAVSMKTGSSPASEAIGSAAAASEIWLAWRGGDAAALLSGASEGIFSTSAWRRGPSSTSTSDETTALAEKIAQMPRSGSPYQDGRQTRPRT